MHVVTLYVNNDICDLLTFFYHFRSAGHEADPLQSMILTSHQAVKVVAVRRGERVLQPQ